MILIAVRNKFILVIFYSLLCCRLLDLANFGLICCWWVSSQTGRPLPCRLSPTTLLSFSEQFCFQCDCLLFHANLYLLSYLLCFAIMLFCFSLLFYIVIDFLCSDAFDQRCGVGILRLRDGLDCSPSKLTDVEGTQDCFQWTK